MKTISYYKAYPANRSAMGRRMYWHHAVADDLMRMFGDDHALAMRKPGRNSHDTTMYTLMPGRFDIAYLELFDCPATRPADFVWASIGDFIGLEPELETWLKWVKPNLLVTRQYYGKPLIDMCEKYGCELILKPQFIPGPEVYHVDKKYTALLSGVAGPAYPLRNALAQALGALKSPDILIAMTGTHARYCMDEEAYRDRLRHTKFIFSTGIYDLQMPPKHIEICNAGACLVSPVLPWMSLCGFEPNVHYLPIDCWPERIDGALSAELVMLMAEPDWEAIAKSGQEMVQRRHTIEAWYKMVLAAYESWKGAN